MGVKLDEISAKMVAQYGYDSKDSVRIIIYLQDVKPRDGWEVAVDDYFIPGLVDIDEANITALEETHKVFKVTTAKSRTVALSILHHIEQTGSNSMAGGILVSPPRGAVIKTANGKATINGKLSISPN